jgi:predicted NBD/HSP70 family sugar kinase
VLALDIHPEQTTIAVTDLGGRILAEKLIALPTNPEKVIGAIVNSIREMIAAHADRIFDGIGISLPGRFDLDFDKSGTEKSRSDKSTSDNTKGNKSVFAPNISWPIGSIKSRVEQATGLPVVVDNVANACALSEVWFGSSDGLHDLVVVNVSEGLGTGIFANGRILRGEGGSAGEFGHVQVDPNGLPCGCGSNGCWETVASNRAGMRYYHEIASKPSPAFETLLELAAAGDFAAREAIEKMCAALGRGMHMIASALAPSEIVVVGDIANSWHFAGSLIESAMRRNPLVRVPRLRPADEAGKARLRSAVALIMNENSL